MLKNMMNRFLEIVNQRSDKGGYIFFALNNSQVVGTMALILRETEYMN